MYAVILAGGSGSRMGNVDKPKQFLLLDDKPIIIHTIEKFLLFDEIKKVLVLVPKKWINYTDDIIKKYQLNSEKIILIEGGTTRNETILNAINYLDNNFNITDADSIITHDSVRPFVSHQIIQDNIDAMNENVACDTVVPATDTIVHSESGDYITSIPKRIHMYMGQTPQTFRINKFKKYYEEIDIQEREFLTDAIKLFVINDEKVKLINGDETNIKITYSNDLNIANKMIKN